MSISLDSLADAFSKKDAEIKRLRDFCEKVVKCYEDSICAYDNPPSWVYAEAKAALGDT